MDRRELAHEIMENRGDMSYHEAYNVARRVEDRVEAFFNGYQAALDDMVEDNLPVGDEDPESHVVDKIVEENERRLEEMQEES